MVLKNDAHLATPAVPVGAQPAGDRLAFGPDFTPSGVQQPGQQMQAGAFTGAGRSADPGDLPAGEIGLDGFQYRARGAPTAEFQSVACQTCRHMKRVIPPG